MVRVAWRLVSVLVMAIKMYAIGMTKDEQARSCMVRGNVSGPDGMRFDGEGHMNGKVGEAVIFAAFVAVTYTGKRGLVALLWFVAVFGLPGGVIVLILAVFGLPGAAFWSIFCLLLFPACTYILVKRHYLVKRTTAGLLKDRQT
jgi:hypothetical protein